MDGLIDLLKKEAEESLKQEADAKRKLRNKKKAIRRARKKS